MPIEVELKARLRALATTEAKVAQLGTFKMETLKEDVYFRRKGDDNILPADRFRLRHEAGEAVVNFKRIISTAGMEVNQEIEFTVDKPFAFYQFADNFGFGPFVVKRKKSRVYQVERAAVELNQVEHLGPFIEIEILCATESEVPIARTEIVRLYVQLGLAPEDLENRYYIVMLQEAYPVNYHFIDDPALNWPFEETRQ